MENNTNKTKISRYDNLCLNGLEKLVEGYNVAYDKCPKLTNLVSTVVGTCGGDYIAKTFIGGESMDSRDLAYTFGAAVFQSYIYPKILEISSKSVDSGLCGKVYEKLGINKKLGKALNLSLIFYPLTVGYLSLLDLKNDNPIVENIKENAIKTFVLSIPYFAADYCVANKVKEKYMMPMLKILTIIAILTL